MDTRNEYQLKITINGRKLNRVIIDQHYKTKHSATVDDRKILELVKTLNNEILPIDREEDGYQYFRVEPVIIDKSPHRLVLVIYIHDDFLGVINAFRVKRRKYEKK
ncbi:MAG: hypothetical protein A2Z20_02545 [Bdellovibrionales bacterium RBG_16_40_8]|nr:MAG: hypothetical protein A2Z20_02545 [Bdellovibrionales bacterium RBG_16_40_8]